MELFPHLRDTLLDFSYALDQHPKMLPISLVFGLNFELSAKQNQLDALMTSLGFSKSDEFLWVRENETYENSFSQSQQGYVSLGELSDWRKNLLQHCVAEKIHLSLPSGSELLAVDSDLVKKSLEGFWSDFPGLKMVFDRTSDPKEQAALFTALGFLSWGRAWQLLFEEMYFRHGLSQSEIAVVIDIIRRDHGVADIVEIVEALADRLGNKLVLGESLSKDKLLKELNDLLNNFN